MEIQTEEHAMAHEAIEQRHFQSLWHIQEVRFPQGLVVKHCQSQSLAVGSAPF